MSKNTEKFINPYYFISLPKKKSVVKYNGEKKITGKIAYSLTTKTPLFIPNSSQDKAFFEDKNEPEHKNHDFYSYKELQRGEAKNNVYEPVIPGSEVRGMIRSIYEAVSGSCMSIINDDMVITNRITPSESFSPGLIKKTDAGMILIEAEKIHMPKDDVKQYEDGQMLYYHAKRGGKANRLFVEGETSETEPFENCKVGYVLVGEPDSKGMGKRKNYAAIFTPKSIFDNRRNNKAGNKVADYDDKLQKKMKDVLKAYAEDTEGGSYRKYSEKYEEFLKGNVKNGEIKYFPVYYQKLEDVLHVSPAAITKKSYENTVRDLLGKEFAPCQKKECLCPACNMFGLVNASEKGDIKAKASSVRFADARITGFAKATGAGVDNVENMDITKLYMGPITIQELAGPKISNAQMYLKKPEGAKDWNYDYWVDEKIIPRPNQKPNQKQIAHIYNAELNGRKFYWHQMNTKLAQEKITKRNVTIRPLREGCTFEGEIYFNGITKEQLKQLVYLCNISKDGDKGYKLGMGKPIGLGSVEMKIDSVTIRYFDITKDELYCEDVIDFANESACSEFCVSYEDAGFVNDNNIKNEFEMLVSFDSTNGMTVSYPYTSSQAEQDVMEEGFKWFGVNKRMKYSKEYLKDMKSNTVCEMPYLKVLNDPKSAAGGKDGNRDRNQNGNKNSRGSYQESRNWGNSHYGNNQKRNESRDNNSNRDKNSNWKGHK